VWRVVFAALAARKLKVPASPLVERCISKLFSFVELSIHPTVVCASDDAPTVALPGARMGQVLKRVAYRFI